MSIKQAIRESLPAPALAAYRKWKARREAAVLPTVERLSFPSDNLLPATADDLAGWLRAPLPHWDEDHRAIAALMEDGEKAAGVNPGDRRALYALISALQPQSVLEVGTHIGASTQYIARALTRAGGGRMTTVDIRDVNDRDHGPWRDVGLRQTPAECAMALGAGGRIRFMAQPSQDFMAQTDEKYDFIFLDGDHHAITCYREMALALPRLNPGGAILLHDYYPGGQPLFGDGSVIGGPYYALERIRREQPDIGVLPLGALPWPTKQGSNITTLALVVRTV